MTVTTKRNVVRKVDVAVGLVEVVAECVLMLAMPGLVVLVMLQALQGSALVEVAGVVAADRTVGGQAAIDVPLRTQAWLLALGGKVALAGVAVPAPLPFPAGPAAQSDRQIN